MTNFFYNYLFAAIILALCLITSDLYKQRDRLQDKIGELEKKIENKIVAVPESSDLAYNIQCNKDVSEAVLKVVQQEIKWGRLKKDIHDNVSWDVDYTDIKQQIIDIISWDLYFGELKGKVADAIYCEMVWNKKIEKYLEVMIDSRIRENK